MGKNVYLNAGDCIDLSCRSHNDKDSTGLCTVEARLLKENMVLTVKSGICRLTIRIFALQTAHMAQTDFSPYAPNDIYLPDPSFRPDG